MMEMSDCQIAGRKKQAILRDDPDHPTWLPTALLVVVNLSTGERSGTDHSFSQTSRSEPVAVNAKYRRRWAISTCHAA
jgi:hypothetical protein